MKMNNKGFAISAMLYGLLVVLVLTTAVILGTMSFIRKNSKEFTNEVKEELENIDTHGPSIELTNIDMYHRPSDGAAGPVGYKDINNVKTFKFCYTDQPEFEFKIKACDKNGVNLIPNSIINFSFLNINLVCDSPLRFKEKTNDECNIYIQECKDQFSTLIGIFNKPFDVKAIINEKIFEDSKHNPNEYAEMSYQHSYMITDSCDGS